MDQIEVCQLMMIIKGQDVALVYVLETSDYEALKEAYLRYLEDNSPKGVSFRHYVVKGTDQKEWLLCEETLRFEGINRMRVILSLVDSKNEVL